MSLRCLSMCGFVTAIAGAACAEPLLIISIDGLHPSHVIDAERHGVEIPHLRAFVEDGTFATGVVGVLPTVTFPSHTTLVTGASPAEHGVLANTPFDPLNANRDGWYWYAEDVRVPTLWSAAAARDRTTASVNWSVTVANRDIDLSDPGVLACRQRRGRQTTARPEPPRGLARAPRGEARPVRQRLRGHRRSRPGADEVCGGDPPRAPARSHGRASDRARRHGAS